MSIMRSARWTWINSYMIELFSNLMIAPNFHHPTVVCPLLWVRACRSRLQGVLGTPLSMLHQTSSLSHPDDGIQKPTMEILKTAMPMVVFSNSFRMQSER